MKLRANCIDETGHVYGKLIVIKPIRRPTDKKTMWLCICECGNDIVCSGSDLRKGKRTSCGKHCNSIKNETGKLYGSLKVLAKDPTPAIEFADKSIHWICQCLNCGNIKSISGRTLRNGDTKSCGCIKSAGEVMIRQILDELGYNYFQEYSFPDLISPFSKRRLFFDFAIFDDSNCLSFLIEYNGSQHEKQVEHFGNRLEKIMECDKAKKNYCGSHSIPLLTFTHINERLPDKESVKEAIQEFKGELNNDLFSGCN